MSGQTARDMLLFMISELEQAGHIGRLGQWSADAARQYVNELAAVEAQNVELTAALSGHMRRRLPNGDPCWCSNAEVDAHYPAHGYWCSKARALVSRQPSVTGESR